MTALDSKVISEFIRTVAALMGKTQLASAFGTLQTVESEMPVETLP